MTCEHGIPNGNECTACLADKSLLLETDYPKTCDSIVHTMEHSVMNYCSNCGGKLKKSISQVDKK